MVDAAYVQRLKTNAAFIAAAPSGQAGWGERAVETSIISPLALAADASAEAQRQADFLGGPLARDQHVVLGKRRDLLLRCVTLKGDRMGYSGAGALVFVLGVQENVNGTTTLTVLKRLQA